jgi:divalent metal cation (Fe/Co/Zn/Cd) transporter
MAEVWTGFADRAAAARRGRQLEVLTLLWGALEAGVALTAAARSGSISLAGFGFDSTIEVVSAAALVWRMSHEMNHHRRHQAERISLRIAGCCLLALAAYVLVDSVVGLLRGHQAEADWLGVGVTLVALICMPALARAKRQVGRALSSQAMMTDATQTDFCMYQAAIVLFGLLVHRLFGVSWADSAAALLLVPLLVWAGVLSLRGQNCCAH